MLRIFALLVKRELTIYWQDKSNFISGMSFVIIACCILHLSVDMDHLNFFITSFIWLIFSFTTILGAATIWDNDDQDGTLEQLIINDIPLSLIFLNKTVIHMLMQLALLLLSIPVLTIFIPINYYYLLACVLPIVIGIPVTSAVSTFASLITTRLVNAQLVICLIMLPLFVPTMICGTIFSQSVLAGTEIKYSALSMICSIDFIMLPITCFLGSIILKESK